MINAFLNEFVRPLHDFAPPTCRELGEEHSFIITELIVKFQEPLPVGHHLRFNCDFSEHDDGSEKFAVALCEEALWPRKAEIAILRHWQLDDLCAMLPRLDVEHCNVLGADALWAGSPEGVRPV